MTYNTLRPEGSALERLAATVRARLDRPLVLVGLMGAGKTRLGRMIAKNLNLPFYDCDEELALAAGRSVQEIVDQIGEDSFHQAESRVLHRLLAQGMAVISTGGGANTESAVVPAMLTGKATTLWVRASLPLMIDRTTRNTTQRPFLKDKDIPSVMTDLVDKLHPLYAQADAVVESRDCPASETLYQAMAALAQYLDRTAQVG